MGQLLYISLLVFLSMTPSMVQGSGYSFLFNAIDLADQALNVLERAKQLRSSSHDISNQKLYQLLSSQIITLFQNVDQNFKQVFDELDKLPQEFLFLVDKKSLTDNYKNIQQISGKFMLNQMRMNKNSRKVPPIPPGLENSWMNIRNLITNEKFFTKLSPNWDQYYDKQWEGVCHTNMSSLQVIYTLIGQYLNVATQYFISKHIDLNIQKRQNYVSAGLRSFEEDDIDLYADIQSELNEDLQYFKNLLNKASRDFWTCDPKEYDPKNPWFSELQAFTKYFTVKKNIPVTCDKGCSHFKITSCKSEERFDKGLCNKVRFCPNEFISCQPSDGLNFCPANPQTYRRYEMISPRSFPRRCSNTIQNNDAFLNDPYLNGGHVFSAEIKANAKYFECLCPETKYVVNTSPVTVDPGHIVIGARFTLFNNMIVIDVIHGKLLDKGYITDDDYRTPPYQNPKWKNSYELLNWDDEIDLTLVTVPENHVVTGIQIKKQGKRFYLELQSQEVDFNSQQPLYSPRVWHTKRDFGKEEFSFKMANRPDKSPKEHNQHSKVNQFVKFTVTGLLEDAGQSTIPFIDTQVVRPTPFTPLSGVSLYVRGQAGYGGFLGIKLKTFNVAPYLQSSMSLLHRVGDIQRALESL